MIPRIIVVTKSGKVVELDYGLGFGLKPECVGWAVTVLTESAREYYREFARLVSLAQTGTASDNCRELDEAGEADHDTYRGRIVRGRHRFAHTS